MSEWGSLRLGDHMKVLSGFPFPSEGFSQEAGLPLVRIRDLLADQIETCFFGSYLDDFVVDDGDILIGMDGDFNIVRWKKGKALLNQRVCKVFASTSQLDEGYLFWILGPELKGIHQKTPQTTVKHLAVGDLSQLCLQVPPVDEQRLIARILDTLDTQIQKTEALIAKLEKVKEGLLHDLLTRGIDENGQLRPSPEQAPELYKESPLGLIPREWGDTRISSVSSHIVDCPHSTPEYLDEGVLVARTTQIKGGKFDLASASRVSEKEYRTRIARLEPMPGDIVFTREAPVGEAFIIPEGMRICLGQRVMLIRLNRCMASPDFIVAHIYSGKLRDRIQALTAGTTNPHLNVSEVGEFMIPLPPVSEQESMASVWRSYLNRISQERNIADQLRSLKSGLMDDLLTGRVRVTSLLDQAEASAPA